MPGGIYSLTQVTEQQVDGTWPTSWYKATPLYAWGFNGYGRLGLNDTNNRSSPVQVGTANWTSVTGGNNTTLAIKTDGTLWGWGYNVHGSIGDGTTVSKPIPTQIGSLTNWKTVFSGPGGYSGGAIKTDGTLWVWGIGSNGVLGLTDTTYRSSPIQVGLLTNWKTVSFQSDVTAALKTDGTLWTWGRNAYGTLGQGEVTTFSRSSPVQVGSDTNWNSIASNGGTIAATKTNGTLWIWGRNNFGQLGRGNTTNSAFPIQVGLLTNWASISTTQVNNISMGGGFVVAVKTDKSMWGWGNNSFGQMGMGFTVNLSSPQQVGGGTTWSQVAATNESVIALSITNFLWAWGNNGNGQVGDGTAIRRSAPVQIGTNIDWQAISTSGGSAFAIRLPPP